MPPAGFEMMNPLAYRSREEGIAGSIAPLRGVELVKGAAGTTPAGGTS